MYAIVLTGGKQYKVSEGDLINVEKLNLEAGAQVKLDVLMLCDGETVKAGNPYVEGAKVTCKVEKQGKGKKITIFKYKQKTGSTRRKQGHRQPYTKLTVEKIG